MRACLVTVCLLLSVLGWPSIAVAANGWSVQPPPSWVVPIEPAPPSAGSEAANGVRLLLFDRQVRFGSAIETYVRSVRQITNEAGLTSSSQVSRDFDPTYETLWIHSVKVRRAGETFDRLDAAAIKLVQREPNLEAQIYDGRQSAVLFVQDLRVGDIVETAFTVREVDPTSAGHFMDGVLLGSSEPIGRLHQRLLVTDRREMHLRIHAPDGNRAPYAAPATPVEGGVVYEWSFDDVKAFPADPMAPSWHPSAPWVQVTDFGSWAEVSAWAARLFDVPAPKSGPVHDWVKAARQASPAPDAYLLRAIRFVQDEIRYVGIETGMSRRRPNAPALVLERRYGDCKDKATLLIALLRLGGIFAEPALVSTSHSHALEELAPSASVFDHVIVRVGAPNGGVLWVDATTALQGGGLKALESSLFEHALPVGSPASGLVDLPLPQLEHPLTVVHDRLTVTAPDAAEETRLDSERVYQRHVADRMRAHLRGKTADEISKSFLSSYQADFAAIRQVAPAELDDSREANALRVVLHFAIPRFWSLDEKAGRHAVSVVPRAVDAMLSLPSPGNRPTPIALPFPSQVQHMIDLELPFDLTVQPESKQVVGRGFEVRFVSSYASRRLFYNYEFASKVAAISADEVAEHALRVGEARAILPRTLTYRAPGPAGAGGLNWAALVVLLVLLPLTAWGGARAFRYEPRSVRSAAPPHEALQIRSLGGWLGLLAIGMIFNPIALVATFVSTTRVALSLSTWRNLTTPELSSYAPLHAILIIVEAVVVFAFAVYGVVAAILFFKRRRSFPFHFTVFAVALALYHVVDRLLVEAVVKNVTPEMRLDAMIGIVRAAIWAAIWVAYVRTSRRAENTFFERAPRRRRRHGSRAFGA